MKAKVILITSSRGGVGKTSISLLLANYIALSQKVCFLEMDIASPTVFYINPKYKEHIKNQLDSQPQYNPIVDIYSKILKNGAQSQDNTYELIKKQYIFKDEDNPNFDLIGASPVHPKVAINIIEAFTSMVTYSKRFDDLICILQNHYDYIIIDTAAGIRDFSFYLQNTFSTDLILLFSLPNKSSVLSSYWNSEVIENFKKRIMVLNQVKEIDKVLFGNIDNFVDYIMIEGGFLNVYNGKITDYSSETEQRINNIKNDLNRLVTINWDESLARIDNLTGFKNADSIPSEIKLLYDAINEELKK